ncbi:MAG: [NiFe]-hydrogenase assembly chaperone HybE [Hyphomicrobiaceae bacterium]|nr:[NiFe]-hydrogenase assembly chaperone HybE [Hyphomicrobiaceae bacterium]
MTHNRDSDDIAARLEAAFTKVWRERMDGVPILNPRLAVEAVGLREWNAHWLCALVTPWFINLILLPQNDPPNWAALPVGEKMLHRFPAGRFEFIAGEEGDAGRYLMCSLFSPVLEFEDHEAARIAASASLDALFDATLDPDHDDQQKVDSATQEGATPAPPVDCAEAKSAPLSRRGFLSGRANPSEGNAT